MRHIYQGSVYRTIGPLVKKIFSTETDCSIKAKFYVKPPWEGNKEVFINGVGRMTKMAAMPIYGTTLKCFVLILGTYIK